MELTIHIEPKDLDKKHAKYCCCADIGGTNLRTGIFIKTDGKIRPVFITRSEYACSDEVYAHINDTLKIAKEEYGIETSDCGIGVAGPVSDDKKYAKLTNNDAEFRADDLEKKSLLKNIILLNDLEAVAWSLNQLEHNDYIDLNPQAKDVERGAKAVIAAGTGLGEAILVWTRDGYSIVASEGGHSLLATLTDEQEKVLAFLKQKGCILQYETILSGQGLVLLYEYCCGGQGKQEIMQADDPAAKISEMAGEDKDCENALRLCMTYYAHECHNLAYKAKATGGIYIAGNIANANLRFLEDPEFLKAFLEPKEGHIMQGLIRKMPIRLIMNKDINLFGAASAAFSR